MTRHDVPDAAREIAALTDLTPSAAYRHYAMLARSLGPDRMLEQLVELEIAVDAFRAEAALARRERPARESIADPDLDLEFARRALRAAIGSHRKIAQAEARSLADRSSAGKMREAARSILYSANRAALALERALRAVEALHRNRTEGP